MKSMTICLQNLQSTEMLFKSVIIAFYRESSQTLKSWHLHAIYKPQKHLASLLYNFNQPAIMDLYSASIH